jgi:hypothetical protein
MRDFSTALDARFLDSLRSLEMTVLKVALARNDGVESGSGWTGD